MMQEQPYFMTNEEWYYFDPKEWKYRLRDGVPEKVKKSYEDFYKAEDYMFTVKEE